MYYVHSRTFYFGTFMVCFEYFQVKMVQNILIVEIVNLSYLNNLHD